MCRRINEIHLLSQAPAPAEARREARESGRVIAVGFFGLIDISTVGRRKLLVIIPQISRLSDVLLSICVTGHRHEVQSISIKSFWTNQKYSVSELYTISNLY